MESKLKKLNITSWPQYNLNYWGITKCANSAVKSSLANLPIKNIFKRDKSLHASKNVNYISKEEALSNNFVNFTVTRHPYQRFISMYKDFGLDRFKAIGLETAIELDEFIELFETKFSTDKCNLHFRSQCSFITEHNQLLFDNVIDTADVGDFLQQRGIVLQKANVSQDLQITLSNKHREKIYNRYFNDFELLGYKI